MRKKKIKYHNELYGLDIETTTIDIDKDTQCSFMYSCCIGKIHTIEQNYNDICLVRTYDELDNELTKINEYAKHLDKTIIIYVHNFSYEHSFFINNLKFFKNIDQCLYLEKNKPLFIRIGKIEFRDSLALLDKSIKKVGEDIGLYKLDYDYKEIRTPLTPLTNEEIKYNYRDVEIMLRGVLRLYLSNRYIKNVNDIPYTKTGISRLNSKRNEHINTSNYVEKSKRNVKIKVLDEWICNNEKAINNEQLQIWEKCFLGGFVFSNPYYCNKIVEHVTSADFSSSYPTQMLYRLFPYKFTPITENKKNIFLKTLDSKYNDLSLIDCRPVRTAFNVTLIVNNIQARYNYYTLSTSRIENFNDLINLKNCYFINGKLTECNIPVQISFTFIDYIIFKKFYNFNIVDVVYLEVTNNWRKSSQYRLNCVIENGKKKLEYKTYNNLVQHYGKYHTYTKDEIKEDYFRNHINNQSDYTKQRSESGNLYLSPKADLNAQYGDNAQHLLHTRFEFDFVNQDYSEETETYNDYYEKRQNTSYIYGVYIVAYARASLCYNALQFIKNGVDIIYTDTDSFKFKDCKIANELIQDFNEHIDNLIDSKYHFLKFGYLDNEGTYDKFITLGTKSYISITGGNITATISGLPKATELYQTLLENNYNNDFDRMIKDCYHYDVVIKSSCVNKLASLYKYFKTDIVVNGYSDTVWSGCVLKDVDVTLRSLESPVWLGYSKQLKYDFGVNTDNFKKTKIVKKDNNYIVKMEV